MNEWQPQVKDVRDSELVMKDMFGNVTSVHCSEGDTLFIRQESGNKIERVMIDRHELYNLIFNFMNPTEIINVAHEKMKAQVLENARPYVSENNIKKS